MGNDLIVAGPFPNTTSCVSLGENCTGVNGVYTFLVHPDGTWNAYVYDNNTGAPKTLAGGTAGDAHTSMTLAVSVTDQKFDFYLGNRMLGSVTDQTYGNGTVGIAVDQGGTITASNFVLSPPT